MAEPLKNLYNAAYILKLSSALRNAHAAFPVEAFKQAVFADGWEALELKQRMRHITECLSDALPARYGDAVSILRDAIPALQGHGLENLIFPDYVEMYGLGDWDVSLPALALFTRFGTSEFAVRPFIIADVERMMRQMRVWADSDSVDVRRLSSEGRRPRLPWGVALPAFKRDPAPVLPILDKLKADESDYVRRSVANNLNDIAKDHPALVLDIARRWIGRHQDTDRIVKHGCRTLLKKGVPEALALFGFAAEKLAEVTDLKLRPEHAVIGESVAFSFVLRPITDQACRLRVEYGIDYRKAGGRSSRKLFKITENTYEPGTAIDFARKISFRDLTTRKHYPGTHTLSVIVNGLACAAIDFEVLA